MMKTIPLVVCLGFACLAVTAWPQAPIVLENAHVRYSISAEGHCLSFLDLAAGVDYLRPGQPHPCARVRVRGREYPVSSVAWEGSFLKLHFKEADIAALIKVETFPRSIQLTVHSVSGPELESLVFLDVPLRLRGVPEESFGACAFSLNLQTRVDALPVLQSELRAACYAKFGIVGAKVALLGMPMEQMLAACKEVLSAAKKMPLCRVAGPWASEIPFNQGSYLFNFGALTEATVTDWIGMVKELGFNQVDNHGGSASFFRFGDFELNRTKWPEGWETYRRIVARLHDRGIGSIFHTYAFFIDKQSKYVTPTPDQRLDAFRTFTLAEAIEPDAQEIPVRESTAGMSTITGFFEHNSVVLHLGNELVSFGGVSSNAPWRFTGVKRGILGTQAAPHTPGAPVRHLKECFGLFVPNPESSLFEEIAARHAEIVNQCQFDGLYLDAIDGSSILRGPEECWYWADKFVFEIQKRLTRPVGMEMSAMWHHFWQYRTRWQAWDYPQRGHARFVDLHAQSLHGGLLLPLHLGWWNFQSFNPPQVEPTFPETMEYLGAKLIGWNAGISLAGAVDRERIKNTPLFRRDMEVLRLCEELRQSKVVEESVRAKLREPGKEFSLFTDEAGKKRFRRRHSAPHVAVTAEPWTCSWMLTNAFSPQPVKLRIEALMSAGAITPPSTKTIADFSEAQMDLWKASTAPGVVFSVRPWREGSHPAMGEFKATNQGQVVRQAAWAKLEKRFDPPLNLKERQALGVWVEGDGSGSIIAIRLESPRHLAFGAIADRYISVDFTGRRFLALVETESSRWSDYVWNDGKALYNVYRETIDFGAVDSASIWLHNLPPNQSVLCRLGPIMACPMVASTIKNPVISVNGVSVVFPVEMVSGSWIEGSSLEDCQLYGSKGESLGKVVPSISWPTLKSGTNEIQFSCASTNEPSPRVKVTVFCQGEAL